MARLNKLRRCLLFDRVNQSMRCGSARIWNEKMVAPIKDSGKTPLSAPCAASKPELKASWIESTNSQYALRRLEAQTL
jgi:hypothetical protein